MRGPRAVCVRPDGVRGPRAVCVSGRGAPSACPCVAGSPGWVVSGMSVLGLRCSDEQVHPGALLAAVRRAKPAGFDAATPPDPFSPRSSLQDRSAFAWSWLGASAPCSGARRSATTASPRSNERPSTLGDAHWRRDVFAPPACWDIDTAPVFDGVSEDVPLERAEQAVDGSASRGAHPARLAEYAGLGFDKIFLHHVGQQQEAFVDAFGEKVLPGPRSAA